MWTDERVHEEFANAFHGEIAETGELDTSLWRAGGRVSKTWPNKENYAWWKAHGPTQVTNWISWREVNPNLIVWVAPDGEPAIELAITCMIGDVPVRMVIDRVFVNEATGELVIVDLKTGSRTPDSDLQLGFYKVGILKHFGVEVTRGAYWMSRKGELTEPVDLSRYSEHLIGSMLSQFNRAVDSQIFIPHLTNLCNSCSVNRGCYAYGGAQAAKYDPIHPEYREDNQ